MMIIKPKFGIDALLFGMKEKEVIALLGNPNTSFKDDEDNTIYVYFDPQLRLTFYQDEDLKLGYIITANQAAKINDLAIIGQPIDTVKKALLDKGFTTWEKETFDTLENHFNEDFWTILQVEFNQVVKIEVGAIINAKDEFEWKFKG